MRTIIAGGRDFTNKIFFNECLKSYGSEISQVISGCAKGADTLGEDYALFHGIPLKQYPANWERYGRGAGAIRNELMAENADALIAFWDGRSKGTHHMIRHARKKGLKVTIFNY
jgi:hypothetical protein